MYTRALARHCWLRSPAVVRWHTARARAGPGHAWRLCSSFSASAVAAARIASRRSHSVPFGAAVLVLVYSPMGRWSAWAVPSWAALVAAHVHRREVGLGRAGASVGREIESSFMFSSEFANAYAI